MSKELSRNVRFIETFFLKDEIRKKKNISSDIRVILILQSIKTIYINFRNVENIIYVSIYFFYFFCFSLLLIFLTTARQRYFFISSFQSAISYAFTYSLSTVLFSCQYFIASRWFPRPWHKVHYLGTRQSTQVTSILKRKKIVWPLSQFVAHRLPIFTVTLRAKKKIKIFMKAAAHRGS